MKSLIAWIGVSIWPKQDLGSYYNEKGNRYETG